MSMASAACLMGDCIVDVDGIPITSTVSCGERVISGLKQRKFVGYMCLKNQFLDYQYQNSNFQTKTHLIGTDDDRKSSRCPSYTSS